MEVFKKGLASACRMWSSAVPSNLKSLYLYKSERKLTGDRLQAPGFLAVKIHVR